MEKIEIDKNKPLNPGDVIEMHFKTTGMTWITATQIALIEWRLEGRKDFRIVSHSLPANNRVIFTIRITEPAKEAEVYQVGVAVTAVTIAKLITVVAVAGIFYLSLDKVYQIIQAPAGKELIRGTTVSFAALAVVAIVLLLRK